MISHNAFNRKDFGISITQEESNKERYSLNQKRLNEVVDAINSAAVKGEGIFWGGVSEWRERYLPQWKLPSELEHSPKRDEVVYPKRAANYLHLEAFLEKRSNSSDIVYYLNRVWNNGEKWFFDPMEVVKKQTREVKRVMIEDVHFNLRARNEDPPYVKYIENCEKINKEYEGDATNLIRGRSTKEALEKIRELHNFGKEIPHMYIAYIMDRKIASVSDPEEVLMKIDVHKGRILINTGVVEPLNGERMIHPTLLAQIGSAPYKTACDYGNYSAILTNDSAWVIGQICKKKDYRACVDSCPLEKKGLCFSNVRLAKTNGITHKNGYFMMRDETGKREETRRNMGDKRQGMLGMD